MVSMVMFASTPTPAPQPHSAPVVWAAKGVPSEFVIGALVPPILLGLFVSRALADIMTQAGLVSEQLYRGERLPTLHISSTESTTP